MDLQRILKISRLFYRDHGLPTWRAALPKTANIAEPGATLAEVAKCGFDQGFAFPPFALQMASIESLIEETARKPSAALVDNQQYGPEVVLSDTWSKEPNGQILQRTDDLSRRADGPYFLFFSTRPVHNAWGRTGRQIEELFRGKDWQGLTVPEYFVLQRVFAEHNGDHRFHEEAGEGHAKHWLWLIDSMSDGNCTVVLGKAGSLNLQACPAGNRDSRRAAMAGRVVPLLDAHKRDACAT